MLAMLFGERRTSLLVAVASALAMSSTAAAFDSAFTYPVKQGLKFHQQDTVNVSWTTNYSAADLYVFCRLGGSSDVTQVSEISPVHANNGSALVQIVFGVNSNNCWFNVKNSGGGSAKGINSVIFSLGASKHGEKTYGAGASATGSFASTATADVTASSTLTSSTSTSPTSSSSTSSSENDGGDSGGLSSGAKAGIGVGVALGVIALVAAGVGVWYMKRRKAKTAGTATELGAGTGAAGEKKVVYGGPPNEPEQAHELQVPIAEMEATEGRRELPA